MDKSNSQIMASDNNFSKMLLYKTPSGKVEVEIFLRNENLWLTQKKMADLFDVNIPAISKHIKNIFQSGELEEKAVISILETTADDGKFKEKSNVQKMHFAYSNKSILNKRKEV